MEEEIDKPDLVGQVAGIIAMLSALVKTLPPAARKRLLRQMQIEFESLLTAMSATGASPVQTERESVEWMRDLFLKRIEQADAKPVRRRTRQASGDAASGQAPDASRQPVKKNVDFEL